MAELGLAWRKHRFVYCCVIVGTCFNVTVLAWHKYATLYTPSFMKIGKGIEAILRSDLSNLRCCDVGITDGRDI
jgi:hypothetical protein